MKKFIYWIFASVCLVFFLGCAVDKKCASPYTTPCLAASTGDSESDQNDSDSDKSDNTKVRPDRMLIWSATLTLEVKDVRAKAQEAAALVEKQGGFVEKKSDEGEKSAWLRLRVPSACFKSAVAGLEGIGNVTHRSIEGEDVTEKYVDIEARLKNKIALRDKLKQHLDKATDVKDIVAIEKELNRVQSDIDSMQAQIKSLRGKADYATIVLNLERKQILGPLGYFFKGVWWGVEKLFVIRD